MIAVDLNQDIGLIEVQYFFADIGVQDIHYIFNQIEFQQMDNTYLTRLRPIKIVAVSPNLIECIEGYKILEVNDIIITDYRLYIIDINLERYYEA